MSTLWPYKVKSRLNRGGIGQKYADNNQPKNFSILKIYRYSNNSKLSFIMQILYIYIKHKTAYM